jgi:uncharacterized membrane protein
MPPFKPGENVAAVTLTATEDRAPRIAAIDALRGLAIGGMIVYHFSWDLSSFGFIAVDVIADPGWKAFARIIAGTFVGLVGVSLVLATRKGLHWQPYFRRLAIIVGAALLVTLGTWYYFPNAFVFFGILHLIAFASVAALPFLRLPTVVVLAAAVAVFALPFFFTHELFQNPLLWWVGFTPRPPATVDYVPVFPWFALTLFGIVAGRLLLRYGPGSPFARWNPSGFVGRLAVLAGRWSLLIYLVHQLILIGILSAVATLLAPDPGAEAATFSKECVTSCRATGRAPPVCEVYCNCVLAGMQEAGILSTALGGRMSPEENDRWLTLVKQCRPKDEPSATPEASSN